MCGRLEEEEEEGGEEEEEEEEEEEMSSKAWLAPPSLPRNRTASIERSPLLSSLSWLPPNLEEKLTLFTRVRDLDCMETEWDVSNPRGT